MYTKIFAGNCVYYRRLETLKHQKSLLSEAPGVSRLPVLFLLVPVIHVLIGIPQIPYVDRRKGAKLRVAFYVVGNRPGKKVDELFVGLFVCGCPKWMPPGR